MFITNETPSMNYQNSTDSENKRKENPVHCMRPMQPDTRTRINLIKKVVIQYAS